MRPLTADQKGARTGKGEGGVSRRRILYLFGGEGGGGEGYRRANLCPYVVDNDEARLANNPHPSHLGDVFDVMEALLAGRVVVFTHKNGREESLTLADFVAAHGSPTCTGYSRGTVALPDRLERYDRLIPATRAALVATGLPYVIENVEDAKGELVDPIRLCGQQFGLGAIDDDGTPLVMYRHRLFESNVPLVEPEHPTHKRGVQVAGAYGGARRDKWEAKHVRKGGYVPKSLEVLRALLDTPWMSEKGCFLSIPPAYTEYVGRQLLEHVQKQAA